MTRTPAAAPAGDRVASTAPAIFAWPHSVEAGEPIVLYARGRPGPATVEIVDLHGLAHAATDVRLDAADDRPDCSHWPVVARLALPATTPSGYYDVVLRQDHTTSLGFAVVRPSAGREPDASVPLLVLSTSTWNAYNHVGGHNLYTGGTQVSFARPLPPGLLARPDEDGKRAAVLGDAEPLLGEHARYVARHGLSPWTGSSGFAGWERPFLRWLDTIGQRVDVATSLDLHQRPTLLDGRRLYLSVGHDEYWSWEMRDTVERFVARGGHAAFLSGNTAYWQVRFEDDGRTMVCFKHQFEHDPVYTTGDRSRLTSIWSDRDIGRPETAMTGLSFVRGGYHRIGHAVGRGLGGYTVEQPDHWLLHGTGLHRGDVFGDAAKIIGYECDGCEVELVDNRLRPTGRDGCPPGTVILAHAPAVAFGRDNAPRPLQPGELSEAEFNAWRVLGGYGAADAARMEYGHALLAVRDGAGGAGTVVAAGCTEWVWGCIEDDQATSRITRNLLERLTQPRPATAP